MSNPFIPSRALMIVLGATVALSSAKGLPEARGGLSCGRICCPSGESIDYSATGQPACEGYNFTVTPCCGPDVPGSGDPPKGARGIPGFDDPGSPAGGGPGSGGKPPITGIGAWFGNEGGFDSNHFSRPRSNGSSGLGSGGGGGGGGGGFLGNSFFGNGPGDSGNGGDGSLMSVPPIGGSQLNPILPDPGTTFVFHYTVDPGGLGNTTPLFFDPPSAVGYYFQILSGPNFASVDVPKPLTGTGQSQFTLTFGTYIETLTAGTPFDFTSVIPGGVSQFRITGNFGPDGPEVVRSQTFDTAISFVGGGNGSFSQTPILSTPEPGSLALLGIGGLGLLLWWRQHGW